MIKKYIFSCLILSAFSCSSPSEQKIEYDTILENEFVELADLGLPVRMKIDSENRLIYLLQRSGSNLLRVYDLDTKEFINSFIKQGEGPNEQVIGWTLQLDVKNRMVYSTDPEKKRVFGYSMDSLENGRSGFWPSKIIDLRKANPERPLIIGDNLVIDFNRSFIYEEVNSYKLVNFEGELLSLIGGFPEIKNKILDAHKSEAFSGHLNISSSGDFLVRTYFYTDRIEKLDLEGNVLNTYFGPLQFEPQFKTDDLGGGSSRVAPEKGSLIASGSQAIIGENEIYVLFDGKEFYRDDEQSNLLFKFDIDLNLLETIYLDQRISNFDIDWKNRVLYGNTWDIEGGLVKYQLK